MDILRSNILFLIEQKGISQAHLKDKTGIAIEEIEKTEVKDLLKLSQFFGVSIDSLLKQNMSNASLIDSSIKMLIIDVDGVLTDGGVYYSQSGHDTKKFHVRDGMGIIQLRQKEFPVGIISSSLKASHVERRAKDMRIDHLYIGNRPKLDVLKEWCKELEVSPKNIAYIGDDLNDIEILKFVGISVCPNNAVEPIQAICDIILNKDGGQGCVREFIDNYIGITFKGF